MFKKLIKKQQLLLGFLLINCLLGTPTFANNGVSQEFINAQADVLDKMEADASKLDLSLEKEKLASNYDNADQISSNKIMFSDIPNNNWAYQALEEISQKYGVLKGMPDGEFEGDRATTRYELAQSLVKTINYLDKEQIKLSAIEQAAIKSLKDEFDKEIVALAARVEINEQRIDQLNNLHRADVDTLMSDVNALKNRHYFIPELRFRYGWGDLHDNDGTDADARLRLTSVTKINKDSVGVIRLQGQSDNFINMSEISNDTMDADVTVAYVKTGSLTRWIDDKYGHIDFWGGVMPTSWIFWVDRYSTSVDMRAFNQSNYSFSLFNTQVSAFHRDGPNGRRLSIGGSYQKKFSKYNAKIQAAALRSTGGSINTPGADIRSSGDESTFYCVAAETDLPGKKLPMNFKVSHMYSFGDAATNLRTWNVGGRLAMKIKNVGVLKGAVIGHDGTVPPRYLGGRGGYGFQYQLAFNPASDVFGKLFGNPDDITWDSANTPGGKTEVGVGFANFHNKQDEAVRVLDVYVGRFFTENIFTRVIYSLVDPSVDNRVLAKRNSVMIETNFRLK